MGEHPMETYLESLISEEAMRRRVSELAAEISADLAGVSAPILVGVLKGSVYFLTDLSRALSIDHEIEFIHISSYNGKKSSSGIVQIRKDLDTNIEGRNVIIVEDIVDSGATLAYLREWFASRKPKSLRVVSLLSKTEARVADVQVEYVGFEIPNEFVVGYGLDFGERYRNLPYIAIFRETR
jgi:hypoxanthine phosphoribosyltransferase